MNNKAKTTFRLVVLLVALITGLLSVFLEFHPSHSGLAMSIMSGMCFISIGISFIND